MAAPATPAPTPAPAMTAAERAAAERDLERVYVWDLVVRITHWVTAFSILILAITGYYLGHPFLSTPGPARAHFATGYAKVIHFYAAIAFSLAVGARLVWMFTGPRRTGWRNFIPASKRRLLDLWQTIQYYALVRPRPTGNVGHNPLAGLSYLAVFALYGLMIATGLALYSVSARSYMHVWQFMLPWFNGAQGARWLHHITMWLIINFFVAHVFLVLLSARNERNGTLDSIFSGFKFVPKNRNRDDE